MFLIFVVIGAAVNMKLIWYFSDAMIFAMVFPNMIGLFFLFPVVKKELKRYLDAIREWEKVIAVSPDLKLKRRAEKFIKKANKKLLIEK